MKKNFCLRLWVAFFLQKYSRSIFSSCIGKFKSVVFVLGVFFLPCIVNFVIPVHSCIVLNVLLQFINI